MADFLSRWNIPERYGQLKKRLKDMGDGTYAEVVSMVLGAGTAAIGKLAANDGVDIGDVTVNNAVGSGVYVRPGTDATWTVAGGAVAGPGHPTINSYTTVKIDLAATTADQVLVAAPGASKQIWVYGILMVGDTADGTVTLQDEDNTALSGTICVNDGSGFVVNPSGNFSMPWIKVATNKALEADTGACTVDGLLTYAVVSVADVCVVSV